MGGHGLTRRGAQRYACVRVPPEMSSGMACLEEPGVGPGLSQNLQAHKDGRSGPLFPADFLKKSQGARERIVTVTNSPRDNPGAEPVCLLQHGVPVGGRGRRGAAPYIEVVWRRRHHEGGSPPDDA